jgi:flavin-dependent dehydrogenase
MTKRAISPRRATLKGLKGGESAINKVQQEIQKRTSTPAFQKYADKTLKAANKIGLKGGAAVMAGGAAGVVVGAAIGGIAAAAMTGMRSARMVNNTRSAAESISRHADDLKKFTGKNIDDK